MAYHLSMVMTVRVKVERQVAKIAKKPAAWHQPPYCQGMALVKYTPNVCRSNEASIRRYMLMSRSEKAKLHIRNLATVNLETHRLLRVTMRTRRLPTKAVKTTNQTTTLKNIEPMTSSQGLKASGRGTHDTMGILALGPHFTTKCDDLGLTVNWFQLSWFSSSM